jgi:hypothetical protein
MSTAEVIAVVSLFVSVANLFLYYNFTKKTNKPAINHFLKNLPPYKSQHDTTEIKVKNSGTSQARIRCIFLEFSWDKDLQLFLHDEKVEEEKKFKQYLNPNEEITFFKRLPEPPRDRKEHLVITTVYDDEEKEDTIELDVIPSGNPSFLLK